MSMSYLYLPVVPAVTVGVKLQNVHILSELKEMLIECREPSSGADVLLFKSELGEMLDDLVN